jgi:hypothetical protein
MKEAARAVLLFKCNKTTLPEVPRSLDLTMKMILEDS